MPFLIVIQSVISDGSAITTQVVARLALIRLMKDHPFFAGYDIWAASHTADFAARVRQFPFHVRICRQITHTARHGDKQAYHHLCQQYWLTPLSASPPSCCVCLKTSAACSKALWGAEVNSSVAKASAPIKMSIVKLRVLYMVLKRVQRRLNNSKELCPFIFMLGEEPGRLPNMTSPLP